MTRSDEAERRGGRRVLARMSFTSLEFLAFFPLVLVLHQGLRGQLLRTWLLVLASYLFYASASPVGAILILSTTVLDYLVARGLCSTLNQVIRKRLLLLSLVWNLGILVLFKYSNFALGTIHTLARVFGVNLGLPKVDLELPPGISYFTFTGISYVLDVYYNRVSPAEHLPTYALHVAFFPKLLAGPIARAKDLLPQLSALVRPQAADIEAGAAYFLSGAVKKLVIADQLAGHVGLIFSTPGRFDAFTLAQGALGYSIQIYCDFSGYSDMAIGCARMMGVKLPQNFAMPYSATSVTEFWRRWHMTLTGWFRDYVFLPLAYPVSRRVDRLSLGRRSGDLLVYAVATLSTFFLCGLWHGAGWTFVLWGCLHGTALAFERTWYPRRHRARGSRLPAAMASILGRAWTLGVVVSGWILFRCESWQSTRAYFSRLLALSQDGIRMISPQILLAVSAVVVVHVVLDKDRNLAEEILLASSSVRVAAYSGGLLLLSLFGSADAAPFIYFQF